MVEMLEKEVWDLSPILNLINALGASEDKYALTDIHDLSFEDFDYAPFSELQEEEKSYLGNFDDVWKFLGQPCDVAPPKINSSLKVDPYIFTGPEEFHVTGDESSNDNSIAKAVRWRDEAEGADLEDNDQQDELNLITKDPGLTKSQKKKKTRGLQKELSNGFPRTVQLSGSPVQLYSISDSEQNNRHDGLNAASRRKQKRKLEKARTREALLKDLLSACGNQSDGNGDTEDNDQQDGQRLVAKIPGSTKTQKKRERKRLEKESKYKAPCAAQPFASGIQSDSTTELQSKTRKALIQQITIGTPAYGHSTPLSENLSQAFVENCLRNRISVANSPLPLIRTRSAPIISAAPPTISPYEVNLSVAAIKKAALMSKLKAQFVDERPFLENLAVLQYSSNGSGASTEGIHVFVDISNVGFP